MIRYLAVALALALPALGGCPDCESDPTALMVDFERCDGLCGMTAGGEGQVWIGETIHPAEHGLYLEGAASAAGPITATVDVARAPELRVTTSCPTGALAWLDPVAGGYRLRITLPDGPAAPWTGDFRRITVPWPATPPDPLAIVELVVTGQSGQCVIDEIEVSYPEGC